MKYNKFNMEAKPTASHLLEPGFADAILRADHDSIRQYLDKLPSEESVTAEWVEALGERLQLREMLVNQKGSLAGLAAPRPVADIPRDVTNYLAALDKDMIAITGWDREQGQVMTREQLKAARIAKLAEQKPETQHSLLAYFSQQPAAAIETADALTATAIDFRNSVVEQLWGTVQTFQEGYQQAAAGELQAATEAIVSGRLDNWIHSLVHWELAA